jgi:pikromycin synthase
MSDVELLSDDFAADPYPTYARWQAQEPAWWSDHLGGWVLTRYADVRKVLTDYKTFGQCLASEDALVDAFQRTPIALMDPPQHTVVRDAIKQDFSPRVVDERLRSRMEDIVEGVLDELHGPRVELKEQFVRPVVRAILAAAMGIDDTDELMRHYQRVMHYLMLQRLKIADEAARTDGREAGVELMRYLGDLRERKHGCPADDIMSSLAHTDLELDEIDAVAGQMVIAGEESPTRGIASTLYALLADAEQLAMVRADRTLAGPAFDEGLRWVSPTQVKGRTARHAVTVGGAEIGDGDDVWAMLGAANRDRERYEEPDRFDLRRRSINHLAWGGGVHVCIGNHLTRLEGRLAIDGLLARFPDIRLDPSEDVEFTGLVFRGPETVWALV